MKTSLFAVTTLIASMALVGCGGNDNNDSSSTSINPTTPTNPSVPTNPTTPSKASNVQQVTLLDANNVPLASGTVKFLSDTNLGSSLPTTSNFDSLTALTIGSEGKVTTDLAPGNYFVLVSSQTQNKIVSVQILSDNNLKATTIKVPVVCKDMQCNNEDKLVGSISGTILLNNQPLANTQVALSGGDLTNGNFANAITNSEGQFVLYYNLANQADYITLLKNLKVIVTNGSKTQTYNLSLNANNLTGLNYQFTPTVTNQTVYWRETFEANSPTANLWQTSNEKSNTGWQNRLAGVNIVNKLINTQVKLAPDDTSNGQLPAPLEGSVSKWYGNATDGNFVDVANFDGLMDGGTSQDANSGSITSPVIDLTNLSGNVSLTFKTWWEVESVNPNKNGFDIMSVEVADATDPENFQSVARLNPFTDPDSSTDNAPLPFTSAGFNIAPKVVDQEPISLNDYKGKKIRLRFNFETNDELYNGFRGWMIDDVKITNQTGTFPNLNETKK
ncbi:immune inhibitor A [Moraxella osloensis]|uniref:Carboxypeptidase regulatory-like domain-containing protein n=1 Tax=Faucicola osloensis TaxID=34062 RepID=A0A2D2LSE0_FAUOS|nr:immune inhibitor A [Moraxella osloensis]ATR77948.1 hypothetical protein NP7_00790 [Moraxella osloensis]